MNYQDTLDQLNITIGDSEDVTFTPEEKQRALTKAWNDSFVVKTVWDSTLTYSSSTYQYTKPTGMTTVKDIYISVSNNVTTDKPQKISKELWEIVDNKIQFNNYADSVIISGSTLYIKGTYKYTTSDTISDVNTQEYITALAGYNTLTALTFKKANLFLKNDTSMSELIALRRELKQEVLEYRAKKARDFESI